MRALVTDGPSAILDQQVRGDRGRAARGGRGPLASLLRRLLARVGAGRLTIVLPGGGRIEACGAMPGPDAVIVLKRRRLLWRLARDGDVGFARGYIEGDWSTPDLGALLDFTMRNEATLGTAASGSLAQRVLRRLRHARRRNSRRGSRRNIAAHYDLGNAFYALWLDAGMNYSSALYRTPDMPLEAAQDAKLERVIELLDLRGGESVLEIGCGWGALAHRLATDHGCGVTGLTLSAEQLAYARARLALPQLEGRAEVRLQDYRDVAGQFDRVVSIEMLEAVGERYWPTYFAKLRACLKPDGNAVLQVITVAQQRYAAYRARPDFIQRYIFPGGMLPTSAIICREAERVGLRCVCEERFGQSYALTLAAWRRGFLAAWPAVRALGFDERFGRMWEYYLVYCETGFRHGAVDVGFYKLTPS